MEYEFTTCEQLTADIAAETDAERKEYMEGLFAENCPAERPGDDDSGNNGPPPPPPPGG
jgi:hypothetical protein